MLVYTCNVQGNVVTAAENAGYHAYYADGVTAIEIPATSKRDARRIAAQFGKVLYVFI